MLTPKSSCIYTNVSMVIQINIKYFSIVFISHIHIADAAVYPMTVTYSNFFTEFSSKTLNNSTMCKIEQSAKRPQYSSKEFQNNKPLENCLRSFIIFKVSY